MNSAALCIIELQNDLCHQSLAEQTGLRGALARAVTRNDVVANVQRAIGKARADGTRVIYCTKEREPGSAQPTFPPIMASGGADPILVRGTWGAQVLDDIAPQQGDRLLARLHGIDPSADPALWNSLSGIETVMVAGISTTFAVEGTVRALANRGFHVVVLKDCCAGAPDAWHRFSMDNVMPLLAEVV